MFARSYAPSQMPHLVRKWKEWLKKEQREQVSAMIADPKEDSDLFPEYQDVLLFTPNITDIKR